MGADIRTEGHHAVVRGVERLSGAPVRAFDVRAGAALVLAGLVADGETVITDAHHVDRGYEDLDGKLVGARRQGRPGLTAAAAPGYARSSMAGPPRRRSRDAVRRRPCGRPGRAGPPAVAGGAGRRRRPGRVAALAYRVARRGLHGGDHRCPRGGEVDPHRPADRPGPPRRPRRRARPGGRAGHRPLVALLRGRHPRRPGAHAEPRPRRQGLHPLHGHPGPPRAAWRWPCPTPSGCCRRWVCPWCWSRRWAWASRRWRWPRPPTPRWSWSTRAGATPSRPTRPACSRSPTCSSSTRPTGPGPGRPGGTSS